MGEWMDWQVAKNLVPNHVIKVQPKIPQTEVGKVRETIEESEFSAMSSEHLHHDSNKNYKNTQQKLNLK